MRLKLFKSFLVLLLACTISSEGLTQGKIMRFGHSAKSESLTDLSARHFAELVKTKLNGRVKIEIYGQSQLGNDLVMIEMLQLGVLDLALPTADLLSAPEFALFEMPYLVRDRDHMRKIEKEIVWPNLDPIAQKNSLKILGVWERDGFRHITNKHHPIRVPSDLKGMKLRTPRNSWRIKTFQAFGAKPTPMPYGEVYLALQYGVIDGQENYATPIFSDRIYEIQKHLSLTRHVYIPAFLTIALKSWRKLEPETRKMLIEAAKETQNYVYENAVRLESESLEKLKREGMEINEIDRDAFLAKSKVIYDEYARSVEGGTEMITKALRLGGH